MRFLGLDLADSVPDANTIWGFREALTRARIAGRPAIEVLFERFDGALSAAGFLAMSGQIVDASIVAAPKQRNTDDEKRDITEGRIPRVCVCGRRSRPSCARRTATPAGRSNTPRPSRAWTAPRASISQSLAFGYKNWCRPGSPASL